MKLIHSLALIAVFAITVAPAFDPKSPPERVAEGEKVGSIALKVGAVAVEEESGGAIALTGCTPKREAAITNIARDKTLCIANMIGQPAEAILAKCAENVTGNDLQNIKDIIFGMKEGAATAGAKIPDAPTPGTYLHDAGAK